MPSTELIQVIIQGGAVGLALVSLGIIWYALKLIGNHLTEVSETMGRVAQVLAMVVDRLNGRQDES